MGLLASVSSATEPPIKQDVVYKIHDDPNSPITFTIWLSLEEAAVDGNSIGWEILKVRFRQIGEAGGPDTIWSVSDPNVPTPGGLWWVDHVDGGNPQLAEFDDPPHLTGVATSDDPSGTDLKYDFEGVSYTPPPSGLPWDPTAALDYELKLKGESTALESGDDEPVEIDADDDPPMQ